MNIEVIGLLAPDGTINYLFITGDGEGTIHLSIDCLTLEKVGLPGFEESEDILKLFEEMCKRKNSDSHS